MPEPWFDPNTFGGWYGAIAGGVGGTMGALVGTLGGILAPKGIGRKWILGLMYLMVVLGVVQLAFGAYAWFVGQPYGIWYGPLLCGFIFTVVIGSLIPVVGQRYRQAEERRIAAAGLRSA